MSSTNIINFSLRQNKSIERSIVFDCLGDIVRFLKLDDLGQHVGFGSVWFVHFVLAHRLLGIDNNDLYLEQDDVTDARAKFNKLYRTLEVMKGISSEGHPSAESKDPISLIGRGSDGWTTTTT